jgi:HAD superfamily hydrolase (TIGR01450 family)
MNDTALPGANEFLSKVRQTGKKLFLLTNNSSKTPEEHCRFVNQLGIKVTQEEVIVSIDLAIAELKRLGLIRVFWLAGGKVSEYITRAGLTFDNEAPQALLLTFDNEITYSKLVNFSMLARKGFPYYATHIDQVCPSKDGLIPDIGCFIDTIECTTGRRPTKTFGKPSIDMVTPILEGLGLNFSDAVVIGDRLYTDIRMAEGTEMLSALVLTGETDRNTYEESQTVADIVVPGISDLTPWL